MNATTVTLDQWEYGCAVAAVVHYALACANHEECVNVLNKLQPNPKRPWDEIINEAKDARYALTREAEEATLNKVAAMQEP